MQPNNTWVIQKIGLQDFWYYDEEEFHFVDGRLLLRGSNGSGKSVTTQSFIPLLLDGNKSAQRLDAFGSKERKMINYLLEEGDEREERIGYLYMEFKRKDSDTYLTIGMANRAKKNGKLTSWYFYIQDGRRIHVDFELYRDRNSKIALSLKELDNRIGTGGNTFTSQKEYMEKVNELLFGFDSIESYQELLTLLIQIRQPKLSKDFKPTKLNEILSSSLTPLSEEDLRPMSEAVENMDTIQSKLESLKISLKASEKIATAYQKYNQKIVYDKAQNFIKNADKKEQFYRENAKIQKDILKKREAFQQSETQYNELDIELQARKEEERDLRANEALDLKEQLEEKNIELTKELEQKKMHEQRLEKKQEKETQLHHDIQSKSNEISLYEHDIKKLLYEMDETSDIIFPMHNQMLDPVKDNLQLPIEYASLQTLAYQQQNRIQDVLSILYEKQQNMELLRIQENALEEQKTNRDYKEKEIEKLERLISEVKQELMENISIWNEQNKLLHLEKQKANVFAAIESFDVSQSYFSVTDLLRIEKEQLESSIQKEIQVTETKHAQVEKARKEAQVELQSWIEQEDPQPIREPEVIANRQALDALDISYTPLYKVIEFHPSMDAQACDRLEAALEDMGLLDALIINEMDKETVLSLPNANDRYIFADKNIVQNTILQHLEIDTQINNIFLSQQITAILESISMYPASTTYIHEDGRYGLGVLHGKASGNRPSKFIGYRSRQRYRNEKIKEFEEIVTQLVMEEAEFTQQIAQLNKNISIINDEFKNFPDGEKLQETLKTMQREEDILASIQSDISMKQTSLDTLQQRLNTLHIKISDKQKACGFEGNLELYKQAKLDMQDYIKQLSECRQLVNLYQNMQDSLLSFKVQYDEIFKDKDDLYYLLNKSEQKCKSLLKRIEDIQHQLSLTNYDEIKQRIDMCVQRLNDIPQLKENLHGQILLLDSEINLLNEKLEQFEKDTVFIEKAFDESYKQFEEETRLGFIDSDWIKKDIQELATCVVDAYSNMQDEDIQNCFHQLTTKFHENKEFLMDYNLMQDSIFEQGKGKRILITARVVGVKVSFYGLYHQIQEDIEIQELLLSNKERELFEDILANTLSKKIRYKIQHSENWAKVMNESMDKMKISSDLKLSLIWKSKQAEEEGQLDTKELVQLLKQDSALMNTAQIKKLSQHFRSKLNQARKQLEEKDNTQTLYAIMKEVFDYRNWFEFQLYYEKGNEKKKELTNGRFLVFSGGEKAISMYVPLFSAAVAKYSGARSDAPQLMALDEAFAGVDDNNMANMFEMMSDCHFQYILNSQSIWGDYDTNPGMAIYQLEADSQARFVTTMPYIWNGKKKIPMDFDKGTIHE